MLRGIYAAASGMLVDQKRLDVVANNMANVTTTGFKRDTAIVHSFPEILIQRVNDRGPLSSGQPQTIGSMRSGVFLSHTATRLTNGGMIATGNPLDVAISGDGFFAVQTPQGVRYTRQGNFLQNADGTLATPEGYEVLVSGQPVSASAGALSISNSGVVSAGGQVLGQLTVVTSAELGALRKEGNGLWAQAGAAEPATLITPGEATGAYQLSVGFLEASNVEAVTEMVEMINVMRSYEASQKAIQAQDETLQKAVTEIGRT